MLLALRQIPQHHQEVILLCDVEDMTYKEIAAALDVPIGTVMSRLHRGRELLRMELARVRRRASRHRSGKRDALIMQCRDVRELADSFLSEQLLVETDHELLRHLETCPDCRADIAARRALRDKLRTAFSHAEDLRPATGICRGAAAKLRPLGPRFPALAVAIVVGARRGPGPGRRRRRLVRAWFTDARSRLAALAREAAGDHQNCAVKFNLAERPIRARRSGAALRGAVRRARDVRAAGARRAARDAGPPRVCVSGSPLRPRRLSLSRRGRLAARHRGRAARGSRARAERG